jgi:hypothetical protein
MAEDMVENGAAEADDDYEQKLRYVNLIAQPLASKKLVKRLLKCVKKGKLAKITLNSRLHIYF